MNKKSIIILSLKDFLTKKMLGYALLPFVVTIFVLNSLFFYSASSVVNSMQGSSIQIHQSSSTTSSDGVTSTSEVHETYEGSSIVDMIMKYVISSSVFSILFTALGSLFIFIFAIFVALIIIGFLTPFIVKEIHKNHYSEYELKGYSNAFGAFFYTFKTIFFTLLMLLLFMPLYFIPFVNIAAINFPFYYMFHKLITFDVSSNIYTKDEYKKIKFFNNPKIRLNTLVLYILSLIPFAILFTPVFIVIYLTHTYFSLHVNEEVIEEKEVDVIEA